jgi:medium-chain acyl-[acyl-carrier-protein] hydrolase
VALRLAAATDGPSPAITLLCVPHLAGNPAVFRGWSALLPTDVAVVPAELRGRGRRVAEAALTSIPAIVEDLAQRHAAVWSGSFALYGHSMGAIVAYETCRLLCELGTPPAALIVGACPAPQVYTDHRSSRGRSDAQVVEYLRIQNGTPDAVFDAPELAALVLRVARADLEAWDTYVHRPGPPLPTSITAVGGTQDGGVDRRALEAWRSRTSGEFRVELVEGDHFFVQTSRIALLEVISGVLRSAAGRPAESAVVATAEDWHP